MGIDLITANLSVVRGKVERRCLENNVDPKSIVIVGVTKTLSSQTASDGVSAGLDHLGENRVREAEDKIPDVSPKPIWHLIGHLQKNKARKAAEIFDIIESVDSVELADVLSKRAVELDKTLEVFIQVNSSGEESKSGFAPEDIISAAENINNKQCLKLTGLMTIGPWTTDEDMIKESFELTRNLFSELKTEIGGSFCKLSMGMSGDYELALDYGANVLRIGTAIFGPRDLK